MKSKLINKRPRLEIDSRCWARRSGLRFEIEAGMQDNGLIGRDRSQSTSVCLPVDRKERVFLEFT